MIEQMLDATHCIDNCAGMMQLPNESIDIVVTSPPYDDLRTYTTAKAAKDLCRHYIGFEINPEYVAICEQRTNQSVLDI